MNCIACHKEATPVLKFGIVVLYICEHCGKKFGVSDQGYASTEEIEGLQRNQFNQIMRDNSYKPLRLEIRHSLEKKNTNIPLHSPASERENLLACHAVLKARG